MMICYPNISLNHLNQHAVLKLRGLKPNEWCNPDIAQAHRYRDINKNAVTGPSVGNLETLQNLKKKSEEKPFYCVGN